MDEVERFLRDFVKVVLWWMVIAGVITLLIIVTGRY